MSDMTRYYFAYGSNMDEKQMAFRCPGSRLVGRARLPGHSFLITERGVASVIPEQNRVAHGLLWTITEADEKALDRYEGVVAGHYLKKVFAIHPENGGKAVEALVYIASTGKRGAPLSGYLENIINTARDHDLPPEYVRELGSWLTVDE